MKLFLSLAILLYCFQNNFCQVSNLIWEDNFNTGQLQSVYWNYETGTGVNGDWGTGQLDRATDRPANISFANNIPGAEDGCLVITTLKENYIDRDFTSGRINTSGKVSWGPGHRIVARVFPRDVRYKGQGFAFWMMPDEIPSGWNYLMWPQGGEIDIMEYVGSIPFHNLGTVHYAWFWQNNQWADWNHGHKGFYYSYETNQVPNPSEPGLGGYPPLIGDQNAGSNVFHTYGIDWYSDRIAFFVDDHVYHIHYLDDGGVFQVDGQDGDAIQTISNTRVGVSEYSNHFPEWHPFEHKMYIILSAGVGGSSNTYGGAIVSEATFPCSVFIDWVKVYNLSSSGIPESLESDSFSFYPNPGSDIINIHVKNPGDYNCKIYDFSGIMKVNKILHDDGRLDVSELPAGTYLITLQNNKITMSRKLVIQK